MQSVFPLSVTLCAKLVAFRSGEGLNEATLRPLRQAETLLAIRLFAARPRVGW
jgi:hypothetical protein